MIVDQGCQTDPTTALAFVSSCPEWFINDEVFEGRVEEAPENLQPFFQKMEEIQRAVLNGRFRTYGELRPDGSECIVLVTEFKEYDENPNFLEQVANIQQATNAHLWIMEENYEIEHSWRGTDEKGNRIEERFGPNHGKPYKQIELSWRVEDKTPEQIRLFADQLAKNTESLWKSTGVGVC